MKPDYYVYVYIDPRNFEEFYYGKGCGSRKDAHLFEESDSAKSRRIQEIKKAGLTPIIRVIARDLSETEALLVEKTLLWKLGKLTTNIATGHFAEKFRPHNTLHKELSGFDFKNSILYYNVGECEYRNWDDYSKFDFISAGQGQRWRDAMLGFNPGDLFLRIFKAIWICWFRQNQGKGSDGSRGSHRWSATSIVSVVGAANECQQYRSRTIRVCLSGGLD
jgi:hypothetical protein